MKEIRIKGKKEVKKMEGRKKEREEGRKGQRRRCSGRSRRRRKWRKREMMKEGEHKGGRWGREGREGRSFEGRKDISIVLCVRTILSTFHICAFLILTSNIYGIYSYHLPFYWWKNWLIQLVTWLVSNSIPERQSCGSLASQTSFVYHVIIQIAIEVMPSPSFRS